MSVLKMAWRNVWRNRRRSLVTVGAMSLALLAMIVYSGLIQGYLAGMERNILDLELGDVQIHAAGYRENPSLYERIEDPEALLDRLGAAGYPASARLLAFGLAAAGEASAGVSFRGVDVERDAAVSQVHRHVAAGRWLDPEDPSGVVLGRRLARMLGVAPGDELVVLTQGADGSLANDLYRVRGVLKGIGEAVDRSGVFMTEAAFRELLVLPAGAHQVIVRRGAQPLPAAAAGIARLAPGLEVKTWRELMPTLSSMLDSTQGMMFAMFSIVYIAIGIVILNAMLMAVFERIREFGVLKALGVGPGGVLRLILLESTLMTGLGVLCGCALSAPLLWYLSTAGIDLASMGGVSIMGVAWDPIWRTLVTPETFGRPIMMLVIVVTIAVLYPALKAALIRPVRAIQHH